MSRISIIVPVYKVEQYLHRCVDSILRQSYSDFELILVDDGSPDNCGSICDEYAVKDSRIHVIHQKNGGLSAARNAGIDWVFANSDSQWLAFVDSDDWIHPEYLKYLHDSVERYSCRMSVCGFCKTSGEPLTYSAQVDPKCLSADDFYCGELPGITPAVAWGKLFHRSLFETMRYPEGKLHEDEFTTYLAVYKAERIAVINAPLYAYFQNETGIVRSKWKPGRLDCFEAFEQQIAFAQKHRNQRLLDKATDSYVWASALQAQQLSNQSEKNAENQYYLDMLRRRIRHILRDGINGRNYPFNRENLLLYEMAYPVKPLWNALHIVYAQLKKILGR